MSHTEGRRAYEYLLTESEAACFAAAPEMLEMLERLVWSGECNGVCSCVWCDAPYTEGHATDCELAKLLKRGSPVGTTATRLARL